MKPNTAKFAIGQVVKHRKFPFRGIIYDVDPVFANTEAWWQAIPDEARPRKDQPFCHLFAENAETEYVAYVSERNLMPIHRASHFVIRNRTRYSCARVTAPTKSRPRG
jgi:heat shock protein HspQ